MSKDEYIAWTAQLEILEEEYKQAGGFCKAPKEMKERYLSEVLSGSSLFVKTLLTANIKIGLLLSI